MSENNKLPKNYLYSLFSNHAKEAADAYGQSLSKAELDEYTKHYSQEVIQGLKDGVCSLKEDDFKTAYSSFIDLVNYSGSNFSYRPDSNSLQTLKQYVSDVPELASFCDLVDVYKEYDHIKRNIGSFDFDIKEIKQFHDTINALSDISLTNRASLFVGLGSLYTAYGQSQQEQSLPQTAQEFEPLPENYLQEFFEQQITNELLEDGKDVNQEISPQQVEERKNDELQATIDDICSFDPERYNFAYGYFLDMTGLRDGLDNIPDESVDTTIRNRIQNIPELLELYDLACLYLESGFLDEQAQNKSLSKETIEDYHNRVLKHKESSSDTGLSDSNLANYEYKIIKLYQKIDDVSAENLKYLCIDVLCSSNKPKDIKDIFNLFQPPLKNETKPFSPSKYINEITQDNCNRLLETMQDNLSDQDFYIIYTILGDTYRRSINKSGFRQQEKLIHMEESNQQASRYYELAYTYAPTKGLKTAAAKSVYTTDPEHYEQKPCSQDVPLRVVKNAGAAKPYSPRDMSRN